MRAPYLELSDKNKQLLETLRQQDVERLIKGYQHLATFEKVLMILMTLFVVGCLLYYAYRYLKNKYKPTVDTLIKKRIEQVDEIKDQPHFLKESEDLIRMVLRERFKIDDRGLTDLELYAFFQGTKLQKESEQVLSLIDQGRFGRLELRTQDQVLIKTFLENLHLFT